MHYTQDSDMNSIGHKASFLVIVSYKVMSFQCDTSLMAERVLAPDMRSVKVPRFQGACCWCKTGQRNHSFCPYGCCHTYLTLKIEERCTCGIA